MVHYIPIGIHINDGDSCLVSVTLDGCKEQENREMGKEKQRNLKVDRQDDV